MDCMAAGLKPSAACPDALEMVSEAKASTAFPYGFTHVPKIQLWLCHLARPGGFHLGTEQEAWLMA